MSKDGILKEIIKDLLKFIEVPDEPKYVTAVYKSTEQNLIDAANRVIRLKQLVYKARDILNEEK